MRKIIEVKQRDIDQTHVTWIINNICPNSCSYCPPIIHNGSNHGYDWNNARRFIKLLFAKYPKIHLSIAGGEPSMSPFLPELVKLFHDAGHTISLTTNGYKSVEYWQDIANYITWIGFSYHPEFSTERYFENLQAASEITKCGAKLMMLSTHWDQCVKAYNRLIKSDKYIITPTRIVEWGTYNGSDYYTEEQLQWFIDHPPIRHPLLKHSDKPTIPLFADFVYDDNTVETFGNATQAVNQGQTNFQGYSCDVGITSLFIGWQGQIKRGNCMVGGYIGSIDEPESIVWPDSPVICPYNLCSCSSDVIINKRIIN